MKNHNIILFEQELSDAPLDQNVATEQNQSDNPFDVGGGDAFNIDPNAAGNPFGGQDQMQQSGLAAAIGITTYSDVGKIWVVKELNKIISNLLEVNMVLLNVSHRFIKFYEDLVKVQELLSIVLFNYAKYKDRFDVILATVKLFLVEYFKEMLQEIEGKVKDEELKKTVKLLILRLEARFYKKVKKETKELKKKEKEKQDLQNLNINTQQNQQKSPEKETEEKGENKKEKKEEKKTTEKREEKKTKEKTEEESYFNF